MPQPSPQRRAPAPLPRKGGGGPVAPMGDDHPLSPLVDLIAEIMVEEHIRRSTSNE